MLAATIVGIGGLMLGGCGGSTSKQVASETRAVAPTRASTTAPSTTASTAASVAASPELIVCQEEPGSPVVALDALSGGPEKVAVTPVTSFSGVSEKSCGVSPDLSKLADLSETSDGSKVAGYLPAGGGSFVNLSGHNSSSYSDTPVNDRDPLFNPVSGELWWEVEEAGERASLWVATASGGPPRYEGVNHLGGNLAGFTSGNEPIAVRLTTSPDSTRAAFTTKEVLHEQGIALMIGASQTLTADCIRRSSGCGLARIAFLEGHQSSAACHSFLGFASDSAVVCQNEDNGSQRFDRLGFRITGSKVKITSVTSLTPPTDMLVSTAQVAPDGKTLWYVAGREAGAEGTPETNLYVVPTGSPTTEPMPVTLTPPGSLAPTALVAGWRWEGRFVPGT
jgi:hypothetical protein